MAHIVTLNTPSREDWITQLANVVTSPDELLRLLNVDADEKLLAGREARRLFPLRVPRAFIARMEKGNPNDPLLRQVLTAEEEFIVAPGYSTDPLEEQHSVVPGLLHKYRNRALLLVKAVVQSIAVIVSAATSLMPKIRAPGATGRQRWTTSRRIRSLMKSSSPAATR